MFIGGTRESVARLSGNEPDLPQSADDWPQFKGPNRDGIARGAGLRTDWDREPPRPIWRHPVGAGWSSFAIVGKYAFTQEQRGTYEGVVCYEAATGKEVWSYLEPWQRYDNPMAGVGPRATPTVAGSASTPSGRRESSTASTRATVASCGNTQSPSRQASIICSGGWPRHLSCTTIWSSSTREDRGGKCRGPRPPAAPDRLPTNDRQRGLAAGDYQAGYASPILATLCGVRQVVVFDGVGAGGYDVATGKELSPVLNGPTNSTSMSPSPSSSEMEASF